MAFGEPFPSIVAAQRDLVRDAIEQRDLPFNDPVFRPSLDGENVAVRPAFSTNDFLGNDRLLLDEHLVFGATLIVADKGSKRIKRRREREVRSLDQRHIVECELTKTAYRRRVMLMINVDHHSAIFRGWPLQLTAILKGWTYREPLLHEPFGISVVLAADDMEFASLREFASPLDGQILLKAPFKRIVLAVP